MPEEKEMYELICKERFDKIENNQIEIIGLLRGKNNEAGLVEQVRWTRRVCKAFIGAIIFVVVQLFIEIKKLLF